MGVEVDILLLEVCGGQFCGRGGKYFAPRITWRSVLWTWRYVELGTLFQFDIFFFGIFVSILNSF